MNHDRGESATETFLPKEYKRNPYEEVDKSFIIILLIAFFFHFGTAGYFVLFPIPYHTSLPFAQKLQERYTSILVDQSSEAISTANAMGSGRLIVPPEEAEKAAQRKEMRRKKSVAGSVAGSREATRASDGTGVAAAGGIPGGAGLGNSRQEMQRMIQEQVSNQGILGILSSNQNSNGGDVGDILSSTSSEATDYVQVYNGIAKISGQGGIQRGGRSDGSGNGSGNGDSRVGVRGGRSTQSGQIDAFISDLSTTQTPQSYLQKKSDFIIAKPTQINADESDVKEKPTGLGGARDIDKVTAVVIAHSPAIQYCYERELKRYPDLKGKIAIRFTIDPAGIVMDVKIISSTLENESVERCILSRVNRWDDFGAIDPSLGNTTFRQVYTFGF